MTFFRSVVGTLISQPTKRSEKCRTFFSLCSTTAPQYSNCGTTTSSATILSRPVFSHHHRLLNFRRRSPLFLSYPPWILPPSATPLFLQGDSALLNRPPKLQSGLNFPYKLEFQPPSPRPLLKQVSDDGNRNSKEAEEKYIGSKLSFAITEEAEGDEALRLTDSYVNWPNFISLGRLLSGPVLGWMIVHEMYIPAFVGLAISGATDWLDGYVARKMGINSVVGSYLDPLADKVLIGSVALAMVERGLLHSGLVALVVMRDIALIGGAVYKRASILEWQWKSWFDFFNLDGTRPEKVEPLLLSKVNTVFQLALVAAALVQPEFGNEETEVFITYLSWLVALTTVGSTVIYGRQHLGRSSQLLKK